MDLQRMIWPWLDGELERVFEMRGQGDCKSDAGVTAIAFLVFLRHLRIVILQDAAAILLQKPERREHVYLKARVFTSEEFGVFQQDMRQELEKGTDQVRATVEEAMPGVNRHFDELYKRIGAHERKTDAGLAVSLRVLEEINKVKKLFSVGIEKAALVLANSIATGNKGREQKKEEEEEEEEEKREEASTQGEGGLHVVVGYQLVEKFLCVQDMVDCWKGKGRFYNMPIEGGLEEAEKRFRNRWRKGMSSAEQQRYSRFKRIVVSCGDDWDRIGMCEHIFKEKASMAGVVEFIQKEGWINSKSRKSNQR